jgi:hypothetical protein
VGFSEEHSSLAPLVYNPRTQHVSPQYHVIFDDKFSTVPSLYTEAERDVRWQTLFDTIDRDLYIDPEDIDAGQVQDSWLLPQTPPAAQPRVDPLDPGLRVDPNAVIGPEGAQNPPEGAPLNANAYPSSSSSNYCSASTYTSSPTCSSAYSSTYSTTSSSFTSSTSSRSTHRTPLQYS